MKQSQKQSIFIKIDEQNPETMIKYVLSAMNFIGAALILIGVFIFANSLSGRTFVVGSIKIPGNADAGFFLIILGMISFGLSFVAGKFLRKKS